MNFLLKLSPLIIGASLASLAIQAQPIKVHSLSQIQSEIPAFPQSPLNPRQFYELNGSTYTKNDQTCVFAPDLWIPNFSMADRSRLSVNGFPGSMDDYLLCGEDNIQYYFGRYANLQGRFAAPMPPQNFPPHLEPGQRIPEENPGFPLSGCRFDDAFWDCDDYAYTWCRLQPDPENCKILFHFTYGYAHAMVIWRTLNADGTWTVCIVEPSTGDKLACWESQTGALEVPAQYAEYVKGELCRFFGLDCQSWWVDSFWRYRYRDPNDWSNWLCGENPWWKCENQEELEFMCGELRRNGIDPCQFNPECPGCDDGGGGSERPR